MKHNLQVILVLMMLFFAAQAIGLALLNLSIGKITQDELGNIQVNYTQPITGRPELEGQDTFTYTLSMILIGTAILLGLIKFKLFKIWKAWFFLAIFGALSISFSVIIPETIALILALALTYLKLFRPNMIIHNLTEVFMYAGIAILLAPLFTVFWMTIMLIVISIYDAIAVWKSKHMITLAKAQADSKMFAGLLIPYSKASFKLKIPKGMKQENVKSAILGGGDIAFPLIFSGSVMTWLIQKGLTRPEAFIMSFIVSIFAGIGLFILLIKGEKNKFYPAMPFITAGCLLGFLIISVLI